MKKIAVFGVNVAQESFEKSATPEGEPWKKLSPATLKKRRKGKNKGKVAQILVDTGILGASIKPNYGRGFAEWGPVANYGVYHFSERPRKRIPKRQALGLGEDHVDIIAEMISEYIAGK